MRRKWARTIVPSWILLTLCIVGVQSFAPAAFAQDAAPAAVQQGTASAYADRQAKEWLARDIPGLELAIAVDGKLVYSKPFGFRDKEHSVPTDRTTKFRIGSISKPLTGVGLMRMVQEGKISLDDQVKKYLPDYPQKEPMTVGMLAGHLAGIRHYKDKEWYLNKHFSTVKDGLTVFEKDPLLCKPGTQFNYSSYGFNLLSAVMEAAAGESFLKLMDQQVIKPCSLTHTMPDDETKNIDGLTTFYEQALIEAPAVAPHVDNSYKWAGGGYLSTAEDLAQFGSKLLRPGLLSAQSLQTMFTTQKTSNGRETGYGIGWHTGRSRSGKRMYSHAGQSVGGHCLIVIYPESHIVAALVTNLSKSPFKDEEVEAIAERFETAK